MERFGRAYERSRASLCHRRDSSDLHAALQLAREDHPNLRAVVLASDGDWNGGQPPVDAAMRYRLEQIPIFTVPVGSQSRQPDVELLSFDVPTFGIVNKGVRIPFTIESSLPRDYLAQIVLTSSNGARQTHEVKVAAMGRTTDAIVWKPEAVGDFTLSLQVPSHPEESLVDNNARSSPIAVREEKLRVWSSNRYRAGSIDTCAMPCRAIQVSKYLVCCFIHN